MTIKVKVYSYLKQYIPSTSADLIRKNTWNVADGLIVKDIIKMLNIPKDIRITIVVNGIHNMDKDTKLKEGDLILLYPLMVGG
jgi:molybdopterin converting factor small subunit